MHNAKIAKVLNANKNQFVVSIFQNLYRTKQIENAKIAFPAVAQTDMFICEAVKAMGTEPVDYHPMNKLV